LWRIFVSVGLSGAPRQSLRGSRDGLLTVSEDALVRCVGAVITRADGRVLLIQRGNEPGRGLWSLPGGRVEPGESDEQAVAREVAEETGLTVTVGELAGRVRRGRYDIGDYFATIVSGELAAATDALDACWADPREMQTTTGLVDALQSWGVLPRG
jgi:ADP-ribose pyrophosphatase YjhB (NUDIX family)